MILDEKEKAAAKRKKEKDAKRAANREAHAKGQKKDKDHMPVSTPAGAKTRMQQLREKLLSTGNSETVLRKLMQIVKDDEHPGQVQAIKMCVDRMMPVSMFEDKSAGTPMISITFGSVGEAPVIEDKTKVIEHEE